MCAIRAIRTRSSAHSVRILPLSVRTSARPLTSATSAAAAQGNRGAREMWPNGPRRSGATRSAGRSALGCRGAASAAARLGRGFGGARLAARRRRGLGAGLGAPRRRSARPRRRSSPSAEVGADVVALLVVGVLAVELAVLGRDLAALGGLLDRQRDPPALEVDVDDLHPQLLAGGDDLLGRLDVVRRHLGDVDQTLDAFADLHERAERHELGDPAVDELADLVAARRTPATGPAGSPSATARCARARGRRRAPAR